MNLKIKAVTIDSMDDIGKLFCSDQVVNQCWCMWFIIPVKDYHAAGTDGNRASFYELMKKDNLPLGLLAYQDDEPVGWCAVGPASRYVRAVKMPTYRGDNASDKDSTWLVPCFFIHKDARGNGVSQALLQEAVNLAKENGATAIDGFPHSGTKKRQVEICRLVTNHFFQHVGLR